MVGGNSYVGIKILFTTTSKYKYKEHSDERYIVTARATTKKDKS